MTRPGRYLVLALLVPALTACDDVTGVKPGDDRPVSEWVMESGPYHDLVTLSGSGPGTLFASGAAGAVLRYDGSEWVDVGPPFPRWNPDPHPRYNRARLALYSPAPGEFFTADWNGTIWHCDSSRCSEYRLADIPGDVRDIQAIWGTSGSDVYASGRGADILHFDGRSWSAIPGVSPGHLNSIWGLASGEVFAAGRDGVVHYDGTTWTTTPTAAQLGGIWGSAPDDVYAVAEVMGGHVQHFDGTEWRVVDDGADARTTAVWGSASTDVFVAGYDGWGHDALGVILHYDGTGWSRMSIGGGVPPLRAVWGTGPSDVWAAGDRGVVLHYDGSAWRTVREGLGSRLTGVDGNAESNLFVVGDHTVLRSSGSGWTRIVEERYSSPFTDVGVVGIIPYLTAEDGFYRHNGAALRRVDIPMNAAEAVWGPDDDDIFVAGRGVDHFDGSRWSTALPDHRLLDVWGATSSNVYAVGERWDSDTYRGAVVHFDGGSWTALEISRMRYVPRAVWGSSESNVFVVGENGVILHWDGEAWEEMESGTFDTLVAVRGSAPDNVYAVGTRGTILRYDGNAWAPVPLPFQYRGTFNDVWVRQGSDVVVVGDAGAIIRGVR